MKRNPMMLKNKPLNGTHLTVVGNSIFLLALQEGINLSSAIMKRNPMMLKNKPLN